MEEELYGGDTKGAIREFKIEELSKGQWMNEHWRTWLWFTRNFKLEKEEVVKKEKIKWRRRCLIQKVQQVNDESIAGPLLEIYKFKYFKMSSKNNLKVQHQA